MDQNIRLIVRYIETGSQEHVKVAIAAWPSFPSTASSKQGSDLPRTVPWQTVQQVIHNDDTWLAAVNPVTALYRYPAHHAKHSNPHHGEGGSSDDPPLPVDEPIALDQETWVQRPYPSSRTSTASLSSLSRDVCVSVRVERSTLVQRYLYVIREYAAETGARWLFHMSSFTLSVDTDIQIGDSHDGSIRFFDRRRNGYRRLQQGVPVPQRRTGPQVHLLMEHRLPHPLPTSFTRSHTLFRLPQKDVKDGSSTNNNNNSNNDNDNDTTPVLIDDDFDDEDTDSEVNNDDPDRDDDTDDHTDNNTAHQNDRQQDNLHSNNTHNHHPQNDTDLSDWTVISDNAAQRGLIKEHVQPKKVAALTEERGDGAAWQTAVLPQRRSEVDKRFKKMLRRGVPPQLRNFVWHALSGGMDVDLHTDTNLYHHNLTTVFQASLEEARHMHPFLVPTFGAADLSILPRFLSPEGSAAARRILCVLAERNPDLDQCPILVPVTALLLSYLPEHTTYSSLHAMIDASRTSRWYFRINALQNASFAASFASMLKKRLSGLYRHLRNVGVVVEDIVRPWFEHFFVGLLHDNNIPFVMDAFIYEGAKILYRFAFAVFKSDERALLRLENPNAIASRLQDVASTIRFSDLSRRAFNVRLQRESMEDWEYRARTNMDLATLSVSNNMYYRPKIKDPSGIVPSMQHWEEVWSFIGARYRIRNLRRRFSTSNDGYSLTTMLAALVECSSSIMLIEGIPHDDFAAAADKGENTTGLQRCVIFGAFVPHPYQRKSRFYGHPDTVVFRLTPTPAAYTAVPGERYILRSHNDGIFFGAGGDGAALSLSEDLKFAESQRCDTFSNMPLCEWTERIYILHIEVYEFY